MKYRIRMSGGYWYVIVYNANGAEVPEESSKPFKAISQAYDYAARLGYEDWDKLQ